MKANDLQFIRHLVRYEMDLPDELSESILNQNIEVSSSGDEKVKIIDGVIFCQNPSSVAKFLFNCAYHSIIAHMKDVNKDSLALGILYSCKEYVYADDKKIQIPALVDFDKLDIPSAIIDNIVEPIVGRIKKHKILYTSCKFTDCCRLVTNSEKFYQTYKTGGITNSDFPFMLCNFNIHNSPASLADLTCKVMESNFGKEKTSKIISKILLDSEDALGYLLTILRTLHHDPFMPLDFIKYLQSYDRNTPKTETTEVSVRVLSGLKSDSRSGIIKEGAEKYTPQVWNQWSQWPMLMGLIEKQLSPMRGSMWPTTENMKKHEDYVRDSLRDIAKKKNKNILTIEEMLEVMRDIFNNNAIEPSKLIETLNKDNRVWK